MRLICFSLYGTNPLYSLGAIENAKLLPTIYPNWRMRVYCGAEVDPNVVCTLSNLNCDIVYMPHEIDGKISPLLVDDGRRTLSKFGMFWKFLAASENVQCAIFRDTDSRINVREKAAVDEWLISDKSAHIMRDHVNHIAFGWPILGGMWGIKGNVITDMLGLLRSHCYTANYGDDTIFLRDKIYPMIKEDSLIHGISGSPFPSHPRFDGFVGQIVDLNGVGRPD